MIIPENFLQASYLFLLFKYRLKLTIFYGFKMEENVNPEEK